MEGGVKSHLILVIIDLLAYAAVPPTGQLQVLDRKYFIRDRFCLSLGIRVLDIQKIRGRNILHQILTEVWSILSPSHG